MERDDDISDAGATQPGPTVEAIPEKIVNPPRAMPGGHIGPYKLLEQIGEGGMGIVFMAEQERPVRRRVALKIIKPGMDSAAVIARFEAERQALAMMEHPNIAHVFDAGTTETGRPFFVMELVQGIPITRYCDEKHLNLADRLELFRVVCAAVQHAHQKGIIHRDLKPSNILVTHSDGRAVPKVIDFGVAKALHQRLTDKTVFTQFGNVIGTLEYMSPEQAELNISGTDTRSDIYSLGVVLYELLTGTTPLDGNRLREAAYAQMIKTIREHEPPKPSTRLVSSGESLASVSALRGTEPRRLTKLVSGDLDWIVMRCLEKDRARRYETADGLARDIGRYLADEPVEASPPSAAYRVRKFVRKHRAGFQVGALLLLILMGSTIVSTWLAITARAANRKSQQAEGQIREQRDRILSEKQRADEAAQIAQAANDFLTRDLLGATYLDYSHPQEDYRPVADLSVHDALNRAESRIADRFHNQPLVEAAVHESIGGAYQTIREWDKAEQHLQRAHDLYLRAAGPDDDRTISAEEWLANFYWDLGQTRASDEMMEKAARLFIDIHTRASRQRVTLLGNRAINGLCELLNNWRGRLAIAHPAEIDRLYADAISVVETAAAQARQEFGTTSQGTLRTVAYLASLYSATGDDGKAETVLRSMLDGPEPAATMARSDEQVLITLGNIYYRRHELAKAEQFLQDGLDAEHRAGGLASSRLVWNLADVYWQVKRYDKAEALYLAEIDLARKSTHGRLTFPVLQLQDDLAGRYAMLGKDDKLEPLLRDSYAAERKLYGDRDNRTAATFTMLTALLNRQKRYAELTELLTGLLEEQRRLYGPQHPSTLQTMTLLAQAYQAQGRRDLARTTLEEALPIAMTAPGGDPRTNGMSGNLVAIYIADNDLPKAQALLEKLLDTPRPTTFSVDVASNVGLLLANAYVQRGNSDNAVAALRQLLASHQQTLKQGSTYYRVVRALAAEYARRQDVDLAEPLWREFAEACAAGNTHTYASNDNEIVLSDVIDFYLAFDRTSQAMNWAPALRAAMQAKVDAPIPPIVLSSPPPLLAAKHAFRATMYQRLGQFPQAAAELTSAATADPGNQHHLYQLAALQLYLGDHAAYRASCAKLLELFGNTKDRATGERTAKACLLDPDAVADLKPVTALIDQALAPGSTQFQSWFLTTKGMAAYRAGNYDQAIEYLARSRDGFAATIAKQDPVSLQKLSYVEGLAGADYFIAMAEHRRGHDDEARKAMRAADELMKTKVPPAASASLRLGYDNWLIAQLAAREAEKTINEKPAR